MVFRKVFFLVFAFSFFFGLVYAGQLVSNEAVNYYNEGVEAQKANNLLGAENSYQKTLLTNPGDPVLRKAIMNNLGIIYAQQGDLKKAELLFKDALKIDPYYKPAQMNLGLIYEMRRTRLESLEYWSAVFELDKLKPTDYMLDEKKKVEEHQKKE